LAADDVRKGRVLAIDFCALCHVAAPDQPSMPFRRPPAPSFESIANRPSTNADSITTFLKTTHSGLDNPNGMSNPRLSDFEVRQVTAYLLSLRKSR
jgi:cytochrome c1